MSKIKVDTIETLDGSKSFNVADLSDATYPIEDVLTSTNTNSALSANQGRVLKGLVDDKQDALVSGTSIKTINGTSLLGSGDITIGGSGTGDVTGPASSTASNFALFDGTTGKLLKDTGVKAADFAAASHTHVATAISDSTATGRSVLTAADAAAARTAISAAAATHTHDIADVTGLQTALDAKLAATNPAVTGTITEDVYAITDGASVTIDPANGSIQTWTLGANRTPTLTSIAAGQAVTLEITAGAYTLTWTGVTWVKVGGSGTAPTLSTTGVSTVVLWKVGSTLKGCYPGST